MKVVLKSYYLYNIFLASLLFLSLRDLGCLGESLENSCFLNHDTNSKGKKGNGYKVAHMLILFVVFVLRGGLLVPPFSFSLPSPPFFPFS